MIIKRKWLLLLASLHIFSTLSAKDVYLIPSSRSGLIYDKYTLSAPLPDESLTVWQLLDRSLRRSNDVLKAGDLSLFPKKNKIKNVICVNVPRWIGKDWKKRLKQYRKRKRILIAMEPPSVMPKMYDSFEMFGKVLTWDDALVDNRKFFKIHYPVMYPMDAALTPFAKKKLCTQISCNKKSRHKYELYSMRLKVIHYFEKRGGDDFDFYGRGWERWNYRNFKGEVASKQDTLKRYRFSFCYENITRVKGYITEKIFDCFSAGCVPIYLGASNVSEYIPKNCFICPDDFPSMDALVSHLKNMKEAEYNQYLENIRLFLKSEQAKKFTAQAFADSIFAALNAG